MPFFRTTLFFLLFNAIAHFGYAENYYWIGGSGLWTDLNHWATTSGGAVVHGAIPDFQDNVIFDEHSFSADGQTVTINVNFANCNNADFSAINHQVYIQGNTNLEVYGNMTLSANVNFDFSGNLYFKGNAKTQTFQTAAKTFSCNVLFDGKDMVWNILPELNTSQSVAILGEKNQFQAQDITVQKDFTITTVKSTLFFDGVFSVNNHFNLAGYETTVNTTSAVNVGANFSQFGNASVFYLGGQIIIGGSFVLRDAKFQANDYNLTASQISIEKQSEWNVSNSVVTANNLLKLTADITLTNHSTAFVFTGANAEFASEAVVDIYSLVFQKSAKINTTGSTFSHVQCNANTLFTGNNTFDELNLAKNFVYTFADGTTQTIITAFSANGSCSEPLVLKSATKNTTATILKTTGTVDFNYTTFRDITFAGGATFNATNFVKLGTVSGLTGTENTGRDLYWVGNSGAWNDATHWAATSGGAGGECVPTARDNVIFDNQSFTTTATVSVELEKNFCHHFTWNGVTNSPTFASSSPTNELHVFGNIQFDATMNNQFDGTIYLESSETTNTITSSGIAFLNNLVFDNPNAAWTFTDNLTIDKADLVLISGGIISDKTLTASSLVASNQEFYKKLSFDNATINLSKDWLITSEKTTFSATASTINLSGTDVVFSGSDFAYHHINFTSSSANSCKLQGNSLTAETVVFESKATISCANATINSLRVKGAAQINGANNTFVTAQFEANATFLENNTFGTLQLAGGSIYTFKASKTQTITANLVANGSCNAQITLQSDVEGLDAFIEKQGTDLTIDYAIMRDIHAVLGVSYTANNTLDLGNNTNWTINQLLPKTYYWIGGSGNWNNLSHWSLSSGGVPVGACLPTQNDHVVFDQNSFTANNQYVQVDEPVVSCRSMNWNALAHDVSFVSSGTSQLQVYGSFVLSPKLNWQFNGPVYFNAIGAENLHLNPAGVSFKNDIYFNGEQAVWTTQNDLITSKNIIFLAGELDLQAFDLQANKFTATGDNYKKLIATSATITLKDEWQSADNFSFEGDNSIIIIKNTLGQFSNDSHSVVQFNKLIFSGLGTNCTLTQSNVNWLEQRRGKISANQTYIKKLITSDISELWGAAQIDSAIFDSSIEIYDSHSIKYGLFNANALLYKNNTFGTAIFKNNATLMGNNQFDSLEFSPNFKYILGAITTQTINEDLRAKGNRCFRIQMASNLKGQAAHITKTTGKVLGEWLNIQDVSVNGGAEFYAANSENLGNSNGWIFNNPPGYIYGFPNDTILIRGESIEINTSNFNTNSETLYQWNFGFSGNSFETDTAGNFHVKVIYSSNPDECSFSDTINVYFAATENPTCRNSSDGKILVSTATNANYLFRWSDGSTAQNRNNLTIGEYELAIIDPLKNDTAKRTFSLTAPDTLKAEFSLVEKTTCIGNKDGQLQITATGGNLPYTIKWNDNPNINDLQRQNLDTGAYSVIIEDANRCEAVELTAKISNPDSLKTAMVVVQPITCNNQNDAILTFDVSGGTSPYLFRWNTSEITDTIKHCAPGQYIIEVTDKNKCETVFDTLELNEPELLKLNYENSNQVCLQTETGQIKVLPSGGNAPYTYHWQHTTLDTNFLQNLAPGPYFLQVTDAYNCFSVADTVQIANAEEIKLTFTQINNLLCHNDSSGSIKIRADGGNGGFVYSLDNQNFYDEANFSGLAIGNYTVWVKDKANCAQNFNFELSQPDTIEVNLSVTQPTCDLTFDGQIGYNAYGGSGTYTIRWFKENNTEITETDGLPFGKYYMTLVDENNCFFDTTVVLSGEACNPYIKVPTIFTPNNDGINDLLHIDNNSIVEFQIRIYNRSGKLVYQTNQAGVDWDGKNARTHKEAPAGVYFYEIKAVDVLQQPYSKVGFFELMR